MWQLAGETSEPPCDRRFQLCLVYSFLQHSLPYAASNHFFVEVKPVKFGVNSFLVLKFKEGYRREQQRKEKEGNSARKRRAASSSSEQFSIRFRTRHDGLLLLASDSAGISVSGYTTLEVSWKAFYRLSKEYRIKCQCNYFG